VLFHFTHKPPYPTVDRLALFCRAFSASQELPARAEKVHFFPYCNAALFLFHSKKSCYNDQLYKGVTQQCRPRTTCGQPKTSNKPMWRKRNMNNKK
jgi:hypothetical protein